MAKATHSFNLNVMGEGLYIATRDFLTNYGYESYPEMVTELKLPRGNYEVVLEVYKTTRGNLRTSGVFEVKSPLVIGDFSHVIPDSKWTAFERDLNRSIMRGSIRDCAHIYTGREGDFDVELFINQV